MLYIYREMYNINAKPKVESTWEEYEPANPAEIYKPLSRNIFLELLRGLFSGGERGCEEEHLIKAVSEEILIAVRNCFLNWLAAALRNLDRETEW